MGKSVSILPDICDTGAAVWHWSTSPLISTGPSASFTCCRAVWQMLHSPPGIPLVSYQYPPPDCPSFFIFIPLLLFYSTKKKKKGVLRINQEVLNCHAGGANCGSDAKRCACDPFKASCSGIKLTLAVRALTQREMRTDERVELQRPAQGHFKRTHVFCRSLWLSWRSNQRPFSFKKGYFTMRPACGEVVNYHAGEGNPGLYSDDCTWEAVIDCTRPDTHRASGGVRVSSEIT